MLEYSTLILHNYRIISDISTDVVLGELEDKWAPFMKKRENEDEYGLLLKMGTSSCLKYGIEVLNELPYGNSDILKNRNMLIRANADWSEVCINLLDGKEDGLEGTLITAIMTHLSTRGGLMLHTSLVDYQGKGILFVGPSGIGKTTQAELWMKYRDAIIINGDMALVGEKDGSFTGYGCPWHGSSPYCENRQVPLAGIIVLEQAKENTLERLHGVTMIERMMRNIFLPHWYQKGAEAAMETVDHLLSTVPVYLLKCRPDEEAVAMVERALFESND